MSESDDTFVKPNLQEINSENSSGTSKRCPLRYDASGNLTKAYRTWVGMRYRCRNPNAKGYHNYGGRGITVCERWDVFENFLEDMGQPPSRDCEIDRIDNNSGYETGNCRWTDKKTNLNNRRSNAFLTLNGKRQTVAQWAEEMGVTPGMLYDRIRHNWSEEAILTVPFVEARDRVKYHKPIKKSSVVLDHDGKSMTVSQWAEYLGVSRGMLYDRLRYGWSHEEVLTTPFISRQERYKYHKDKQS